MTELYHYSKVPVHAAGTVMPGNELIPMKPRGLWVSDDDDYGWAEWCAHNVNAPSSTSDVR